MRMRFLEEQPELLSHLQLPWGFWHKLSKSRLWGEAGPQAISFQEFQSEFGATGLQGREFREDLLEMIQALDQVYLGDYAEKAKARNKNVNPANSDPVPRELGRP